MALIRRGGWGAAEKPIWLIAPKMKKVRILMLTFCYVLTSPRIGRFLPIFTRFYSSLKEDSRRGLWNESPRAIRDILTSRRVEVIDLALKPYLPTQLQQEPAPTIFLPPSYHFGFFPTSGSSSGPSGGVPVALEDGYESHFAPRRLFKRRVWTQGRLNFGDELRIGEAAQLNECLLRVVERDQFTDVWIERRITSLENHERSITEMRCLRYLFEIPSSSPNDTVHDIDETIKNAMFTYIFTPSRSLLTQYSHLTDNAHRIHLDPEYARSEGYPTVLVHGSLSITFVLKILSHLHTSEPKFKINSARYIMYRPLYVNNPVRLTISTYKPDVFRATLWTPLNQKAVECFVTVSSNSSLAFRIGG
jgi:hydroxyacyl-ACP dehydratase HTD2-like protein with hotdog domain